MDQACCGCPTPRFARYPPPCCLPGRGVPANPPAGAFLSSPTREVESQQPRGRLFVRSLLQGSQCRLNRTQVIAAGIQQTGVGWRQEGSEGSGAANRWGSDDGGSPVVGTRLVAGCRPASGRLAASQLFPGQGSRCLLAGYAQTGKALARGIGSPARCSLHLGRRDLTPPLDLTPAALSLLARLPLRPGHARRHSLFYRLGSFCEETPKAL